MITRREFLQKSSMGFGALAFSGIAQNDLLGAEMPLYPKTPHFAPKAKNVIFLYMDGGVSQVDSFDPKPQLAKEHGQPPKFQVDATVFNNNGNLLKSPWDFSHYGQSGIPISDLFPHIGSCADDLCVLRSMTAFSPNHPNANYALHCGHVLSGRPSMGAWASYGLGTLSQNLPSFVVIHGGQVPAGGMQAFGSGFLPANHQGSTFLPQRPILSNTTHREDSAAIQRKKLEFLHEMDGDLEARLSHAEAIESAIQNYELAYRMQMEVPEVTDISGESDATKTLYGIDAPYENTRQYGAQCLMARRLVERGVRFVELTINPGNGDRWDQHSKLVDGHQKNAMAVDQPIAGLIKDLKSRGLLDSTLLVFSGEFGRTPFAQGTNGRDHNPQGFSLWMAGGGIKGGTIYGATDEYGYRVVENKLTVHDLHANMLHLLGIDHTRLTFRYSGRDIRLTDVHGEIIPEILA
ncbi:MAG: sulfatase [Opitutales bacterium TMED158]|nr:MAG: sulfatase [Opitutales bacterium TMED158]